MGVAHSVVWECQGSSTGWRRRGRSDGNNGWRTNIALARPARVFTVLAGLDRWSCVCAGGGDHLSCGEYLRTYLPGGWGDCGGTDAASRVDGRIVQRWGAGAWELPCPLRRV